MMKINKSWLTINQGTQVGDHSVTNFADVRLQGWDGGVRFLQVSATSPFSAGIGQWLTEAVGTVGETTLEALSSSWNPIFSIAYDAPTGTISGIITLPSVDENFNKFSRSFSSIDEFVTELQKLDNPA